MLTATQLFDLVKARKVPTHLGPRGGHYYEAPSGQRIYVGQADKTTAPLAHVLATTPHSGPATQGPVEVKVIPSQGTPSIQRMYVRAPQGLTNRRASREHIRQSTARWSGFFCKNCGTAVDPHWDVPVVPGAKIYSDPKTKRPVSVGTEHGELPEMERETLRVYLTKPNGERTTTEGYEPEAAAAKLCPDCYSKNEMISRQVVLHDESSAPKPLTAEEKQRARAEAKERTRQQKVLAAGLAKQPGKRSEEERKLVSQHEAEDAVRRRVAEQKAKAEERLASRKHREEASLERREDEAQAELRGRMQAHLERQGKSKQEAFDAAQRASVQELIAYARDRRREDAERGERTRQEVSKEVGGKRIPVAFDLGDLLEHMLRRQQHLPGGEERGVFRETFLNPATRRAEEEKRTERLRERQKEQESKTRKSVSLWLTM